MGGSYTHSRTYSCRRRQSKCAGARNYEDSNSRNEPLNRISCISPHCEGHDRNNKHNRHKNTRHFIYEMLDRRFGRLCLLYQCNNMCKHSLLSRRGCLHLDKAVRIHGSSDHTITHLFVRRQWLSCNHRLIQCTKSFYNHTIHRHFGSWLDMNNISHDHLLYRNLHYLSSSLQQRTFCLQMQ